jgi:hypothetical protein
LEDHLRTTYKLVDLSGVPWSSCQWILCEELQMKRVAAKFVPNKALNVKQFLTKNSLSTRHIA